MTIVPSVGDHIYREGSSRFFQYSHHGIVVGPDEVIHFFKGKKDKHHTVKSTSLEEFSAGKRFEIKEYVRIVEEIEEITGERLPSDIAERIVQNTADIDRTVQRARALLGQGAYSLWTNNCEHLAMYCKTGREFSHQVGLFSKLLRSISYAQRHRPL